MYDGHCLCKGCSLYGAGKYICRVTVKKQLKCPCMDCLVKPICTMGCNERSEYGEYIIENYGSPWKSEKTQEKYNDR
jgi:hypothetical protein